jgi:hypothetical protein
MHGIVRVVAGICPGCARPWRFRQSCQFRRAGLRMWIVQADFNFFPSLFKKERKIRGEMNRRGKKEISHIIYITIVCIWSCSFPSHAEKSYNFPPDSSGMDLVQQEKRERSRLASWLAHAVGSNGLSAEFVAVSAVRAGRVVPSLCVLGPSCASSFETERGTLPLFTYLTFLQNVFNPLLISRFQENFGTLAALRARIPKKSPF